MNHGPNHGLLERDLIHIRAAAEDLSEITQVILFGSRAKGTHHLGSDVDLAIEGKGITHSTVIRLLESLNEERPLPYFFDVVDYDSLGDEPLRDHIDRVGIVLYPASADGSKEKSMT